MDILNNILDFGDLGLPFQGGGEPVVQIYSISLSSTRLKDMKLEAVDFSNREVLKDYLL